MSETDIDPSQYSSDFRYAPLEASESRLYLGIEPETSRRVALKAYKEVPMEKLRQYADLTNALAEKHDGDMIRMSVNGQEFDFAIKIVRIEKVGISPMPMSTKGETCPCTVSEFVEGDTLFKAEYEYRQEHPRDLSEPDPLTDLGRRWREETGANNISVINWNVKPVFKQDGNTLVITDVCGIVSDLEIDEKDD